MERYRKKPIVIEAERWFEVTYDRYAGHAFGGHASPVYHLDVGYYRHPDVDGSVKCEHCGVPMRLHGWIDTLEGGHTVCPGDWIIQGVMGEMYPCKDVIFKMTYEKYCPTNQKEALDEDVASATPVLENGISVGLPAPSEDVIATGCFDELEDLGFDAEQETLEILSDDDCMAGIRKSMEQINNGEGIPLSELYPMKTATFGMGIEINEWIPDGVVKVIDNATLKHVSIINCDQRIPHYFVDDVNPIKDTSND